MKKKEWIIIVFVVAIFLGVFYFFYSENQKNKEINENLRKEIDKYSEGFEKSIDEATGNKETLNDIFPNIKTVDVGVIENQGES